MPEKRIPYVARADEQVVPLHALNPTRKHLQLSTDNKKLIYCCKKLAFSDGTSFKRSKKPSYCRAQGGVYGK